MIGIWRNLRATTSGRGSPDNERGAETAISEKSKEDAVVSLIVIGQVTLAMLARDFACYVEKTSAAFETLQVMI